MDYKEATAYLFSRRQMAAKLGLEPVRTLLDGLDHPERHFPSIHIAGTNGKGSTAAMLESILREAGYRTGLYTSPHLVDMQERIRISGLPISRQEVIDDTLRLMPLAEAVEASFFEILTAMGFLHFSQNKVAIAVLETGLGGRLDATNVVTPLLSIITEIGLEHTKILGRRLELIAGEKAGILKPNIPAIIGTKNKKINLFFNTLANERKTPLVFSGQSIRFYRIRLSERGSRFDVETKESVYPDLYLRLLGPHQVDNCGLVLLAVDELRKMGWNISERAVRTGLEKVVWRARLELLSQNPKIIIDSAHNPMGIRSLVKTLKQLFQYEKLIVVFGVLMDKDYKTMLHQISKLADFMIFTRPNNDRALDPEQLLRLHFIKDKRVRVIIDIAEAWSAALRMARENDLVCGTGSIYFVGEVLKLSGIDDS